MQSGLSKKPTVSIVEFIYSDKATKFCEISTNCLPYVLPVKYLLEISQNFVAISEYMNFTWCKNKSFWQRFTCTEILGHRKGKFLCHIWLEDLWMNLKVGNFLPNRLVIFHAMKVRLNPKFQAFTYNNIIDSDHHQ